MKLYTRWKVINEYIYWIFFILYG